jgi:hypothetical protein
LTLATASKKSSWQKRNGCIFAGNEQFRLIYIIECLTKFAAVLRVVSDDFAFVVTCVTQKGEAVHEKELGIF